VEPMTPKGKGKKRRRDYEHMEEVIPIGGEGAIPLVVIAENAWPVLDWLLVVLERDELLMEKSGSPRHSPILLSQIPPPRSGTGARWEADAPLDIVFYCLEQTAPKRRAMGARLITLLINLASTIHFDFSLFITSVYTRLSSSSSTTSADTFSVLFSALVPLPAISQFKLALCKKYLTSSATTPGSADGLQTAFRPRPQARAARPAQRSGVPEHENSASSIKSTASDSTSATTSIASKYTLPPPSEIVQLIAQPLGGTLPPKQLLRIKFELLLSYIMVQKTAVGPGNLESERRHILLHEKVQQAVDAAFSGEGGGMYRESLQSIMETL